MSNGPRFEAETADGEGPTSEIRKALVVSVSDYDLLQTLDFCENDGQDTYQLLKARLQNSGKPQVNRPCHIRIDEGSHYGLFY